MDEFSKDALIHVGMAEHVKADVLAGRSPVPVTFEYISMLAAEVVNFSEICAAIGAENAFALIYSIETAIDETLKGYSDICKVKYEQGQLLVTIGLSHANSKGKAHLPESTATLLCFAQDLQLALSEVQVPGAAQETFVEIKVGVHTGSVNGGLIGTTFPTYHLIGSAVSQTHLIATSSEPGFIQVTQAAKTALGETCAFFFEERGQVVVDGNEITCFYLD
jgi:adenylate cyclase